MPRAARTGSSTKTELGGGMKCNNTVWKTSAGGQSKLDVDNKWLHGVSVWCRHEVGHRGKKIKFSGAFFTHSQAVPHRKEWVVCAPHACMLCVQRWGNKWNMPSVTISSVSNPSVNIDQEYLSMECYVLIIFKCIQYFIKILLLVLT